MTVKNQYNKPINQSKSWVSKQKEEEKESKKEEQCTAEPC